MVRVGLQSNLQGKKTHKKPGLYTSIPDTLIRTT